MINIKFQFYFRHLKVELVPCRLKTTVDILRLHYSFDFTVSVSDQGTLYKKVSVLNTKTKLLSSSNWRGDGQTDTQECATMDTFR